MVVCGVLHILLVRVYGIVSCAGGLFKQAHGLDVVEHACIVGLVGLGAQLDFYGLSVVNHGL